MKKILLVINIMIVIASAGYCGNPPSKFTFNPIVKYSIQYKLNDGATESLENVYFQEVQMIEADEEYFKYSGSLGSNVAFPKDSRKYTYIKYFTFSDEKRAGLGDKYFVAAKNIVFIQEHVKISQGASTDAQPFEERDLDLKLEVKNKKK